MVCKCSPLSPEDLVCSRPSLGVRRTLKFIAHPFIAQLFSPVLGQPSMHDLCLSEDPRLLQWKCLVENNLGPKALSVENRMANEGHMYSLGELAVISLPFFSFLLDRPFKSLLD